MYPVLLIRKRNMGHLRVLQSDLHDFNHERGMVNYSTERIRAMSTIFAVCAGNKYIKHDK
jgi:hypothetical protein